MATWIEKAMVDRQQRSEAKIAERLNKTTGSNFTAADINDWLEGDDEYDAINVVVRRYLGEQLYDEAEIAARTVDVLEAKLAGKKSVTAGGVNSKICNRDSREQP